MYEDQTVAVVIPAYNEEEFVGEVIETVPEYVDRVYPVDDRSEDGTWDEMRAAAERVNGRRTRGALSTDGGSQFAETVVPIRHERNRGVGGAIKTGLERADDDGVDVLTVMDGDGQMDPDLLYRFLDPIVEGRADYTKGNRLLDWSYLDGMSNWRLFGNMLLTFLTKIASGYWKSMDPQNGYNAVSMAALDEIDIDGLYDQYGFRNDLLIRLNIHGKRVADVSMPAMYGEEVSSIRYSQFVRTVSVLLLTGFLRRLNLKYLVYDFNPLALFYYAGAGAGLVGLTATGYGAVTAALGGAFGGVGVAGTVSLLFGVFFLLFAMYLDAKENERLELRV